MQRSNLEAARLGLLLGLLAAASPAAAETTSDAMLAFGLVGSWSADCSTDMTRPCVDIDRCYPRLTFIVPLQGAPAEEVMSPSAVAGLVYKNKIAIDAVTQLSGDKIQITTTAAIQSGDPATTLQARGETWETIYQKNGANLRVWSARQANGAKIAVRDGYRYEPDGDSTSANGQVSQWRRTSEQTAALQKCVN
jgi:hypothetical protein